MKPNAEGDAGWKLNGAAVCLGVVPPGDKPPATGTVAAAGAGAGAEPPNENWVAGWVVPNGTGAAGDAAFDAALSRGDAAAGDAALNDGAAAAGGAPPEPPKL